MAKVAARNGSFGLEDATGTCRALSPFLSSITLSYTAETPEVTGFGSDNRERLSDGIKDWELSFDAFFSSGANETDALLSSVLGGSTRFVFGPTGSNSGSVMYTACAILTSYELTFGVEDAGQCSGTLVGRSGSLTRTVFS